VKEEEEAKTIAERRCEKEEKRLNLTLKSQLRTQKTTLQVND